MKKLDKNEIMEMEERYELLKEKMFIIDIINIVDEFESFIEECEGDIPGATLQSFWEYLSEEYDVSLVDVADLFVFYVAGVVEW